MRWCDTRGERVRCACHPPVLSQIEGLEDVEVDVWLHPVTLKAFVSTQCSQRHVRAGQRMIQDAHKTSHLSLEQPTWTRHSVNGLETSSSLPVKMHSSATCNPTTSSPRWMAPPTSSDLCPVGMAALTFTLRRLPLHQMASRFVLFDGLGLYTRLVTHHCHSSCTAACSHCWCFTSMGHATLRTTQTRDGTSPLPSRPLRMVARCRCVD